ncbi:DUF881 domain-containing protein [Hoyosella rhizosphaerae]|uniref:DUF881 domain-containing protein n=1 Tax=Hoyosella rhizosphaerae TaxID=1755582 RepID=A0A916U149_9ACTN|nr:DUF881 domain-containing protein [Hoyosella rhizosphaerae]MBN4927304.1 DUF881 domain-containing protein [Hoyosella rhizosphaerae]GGC52338.1 hypothetical protein GCM10011410_00820 [Hoyosella rhizosphaerae]
MTDHLDPGYAKAAAKESATKRGARSAQVWFAVGALLIGVSLGSARGWAELRADDTDSVRSALRTEVRAAQTRTAQLADERDELVEEISNARNMVLDLDGPDGAILEQVRRTQFAAASVPVRGPGIEVVLSEPAGERNTILDRDLQIVINSLWAAGAEAVSVGGVRIGPHVAIRQAGSAILVDNRVVPQPYVVSAIGEPRQVQASFLTSGAYMRMSGISQLYGVGFVVRDAADISMPAASVREVRIAQEQEDR